MQELNTTPKIEDLKVGDLLWVWYKKKNKAVYTGKGNCRMKYLGTWGFMDLRPGEWSRRTTLLGRIIKLFRLYGKL